MPFTRIKDQNGNVITVNNDYLGQDQYKGYTVDNTIPKPKVPKDNLADLQQRKAIEDLENARDSALSNLGAEKAKIKPRYYDARNVEAATNQQQARNFAEYMANRGGTTAGSNEQATMVQNGVYQGNLGSLKRQETADFADIARRETEVNNNYEHDLASAQLGIQANALERQREDARYGEERDYNRLQDNKSEYGNTVGQFYNDYQAEIDKVKNDGDPSNDWQINILGAARQQKIRELQELEQAMTAASSTAEAKAIQQKFENDLKQKQYELDLKKTNYDTNKPYYSPNSGGSGTDTPQYIAALTELDRQIAAGTAGAWIEQNGPGLQQDLGPKAYLDLYEQYRKYKNGLKPPE